MAKTKEARLQKTKFNSIGVRRQYHTQKGGLEVVIHITVNKNEELAKRLGFFKENCFMFADVNLIKSNGYYCRYTDENKDDLMKALGIEQKGNRFYYTSLRVYDSEESIDQYAEEILAAV